MELLIAGSLAYDSIESLAGSVSDTLGGSATYAALSARFHLSEGRIGIIGAVGDDFLPKDWDLLENKGIDMSSVDRLSGETFRWHGRYQGGDADAITVDTRMNVIDDYHPSVPPHALTPAVFLCGNLHPRLQRSLLSQIQPGLLIVDTMNRWISGYREELNPILSRADIIVINRTELEMLTGLSDISTGAASLREGECLGGEGPSVVVIKLGSNGAKAFGEWGVISSHGIPIEQVVDPTGCGDVFAGALAAHLLGNDSTDMPSKKEMQAALSHANRTASVNLKSFGVKAMVGLDQMTYENVEGGE